MTQTLLIEIDEEFLEAFQKNPEQMAAEMRLAAAAKWYEMGSISQEKAARMAGLAREDFILALARFEVAALQETAADVLQSVRDL